MAQVTDYPAKRRGCPVSKYQHRKLQLKFCLPSTPPRAAALCSTPGSRTTVSRKRARPASDTESLLGELKKPTRKKLIPAAEEAQPTGNLLESHQQLTQKVCLWSPAVTKSSDLKSCLKDVHQLEAQIWEWKATHEEKSGLLVSKGECAEERRKSLNFKPKSMAERAAELMLQLRQEVMEQQRKKEEAFKAAVAGAGQPVKRTTCQVTQAVDFHFRTDDWLKRHPAGQSGDEYKEVDFLAALRRHPSTPARVPKRGCHTVPKAFNRSQGKNRKLKPDPCVCMSTAQQVEAFHKHTPSHCHLWSRQQENEGPSPVNCGKAMLTNPMTTRLETKLCCRPVTCKSTVELKKQQQYKFRAQELDPRVLDWGLTLPRKQSVKEPTKAFEFNLVLEKWIQEQKVKMAKPEEEKFTFRSRQCPAHVLEEVVIQEELKQQKEAAFFKARLKVIHREPFVPKKDSKMLENLSGSVVPDIFELVTEKRAKERQEFEKWIADVTAQEIVEEEHALVG